MSKRRIPVHSKAELNAVALKAQAGDQKAAAQLAVMMRPYVVSLVRRFDTLGDYTREQSDDINQAAWVGVWVALEKFDASQDVKFSTYAWYWARHEVQTHMSNHSRALPMTRSAWSAAKEIEDTWNLAHPDRSVFDASDNELEALDIEPVRARKLLVAKSAPLEVNPAYDTDDADDEAEYRGALDAAALDAYTTVEGLLAEGDEDGALDVAYTFAETHGLGDDIAENMIARAKL